MRFLLVFRLQCSWNGISFIFAKCFSTYSISLSLSLRSKNIGSPSFKRKIISCSDAEKSKEKCRLARLRADLSISDCVDIMCFLSIFVTLLYQIISASMTCRLALSNASCHVKTCPSVSLVFVSSNSSVKASIIHIRALGNPPW